MYRRSPRSRKRSETVKGGGCILSFLPELVPSFVPERLSVMRFATSTFEWSVGRTNGLICRNVTRYVQAEERLLLIYKTGLPSVCAYRR